MIKFRALRDQGSEITLASENLVQSLNLKRETSSVSVTGVGAKDSGRTRGVANFVIKPHFDSTNTLEVRAHILLTLTSSIPSATIPTLEIPHIQGLSLADPEFRKSGPIDLIIGADLYGELIDGPIVKGPKNFPIAQSTLLGWVVSGPIYSSAQNSRPAVYHCSIDHDLQSTLERFWYHEEVVPQVDKSLSVDDQACEDHFKNTVTRDELGRYIVRLPFKHPTSSIGSSKGIALQMLTQLHKKFASCPTLLQDYCSFLQEYEDLDHMSRIANIEAESKDWFLSPASWGHP